MSLPTTVVLNITRPYVKFSPSVWGDRFIQYADSELTVQPYGTLHSFFLL